MRKAVPLGLGLIGVALAEVYVVDPSIDQYKQKTDQTFYDTYQNSQSIIARAMQRKNSFNFNALSTDQRLTSTRLDTLPLMTDVNAHSGAGLSVTGGRQRRVCWVWHPDYKTFRYEYTVDDDGVARDPNVSTWGSYHYRYGWYKRWGKTYLSRKTIGIGWDTGSVWCVATCGGGCVRQKKAVRKLMLDTACRNASVYRTEYERVRSCWRCGKSTCYGSWSSWYEVSSGQVEDIISLTGGIWSTKGAVLSGYAYSYKLY